MERRVRIELLGPLRVWVGETRVTRFRSQQTAALLGFLAANPGRPHGREALMERFWPEQNLTSARNSLNSALSSLRAALEPPGVPHGAVLATDRLTVRLEAAAVTTDLQEFDAALARAERAGSEGARGSGEVGEWGTSDELVGERREALATAVDLYQGPLLEGLYDDWTLAEQSRTADRFQQAVGELVDLLEKAEEGREALAAARRAVSADPQREEGHRRVMRLLALGGEPAAARRQFEMLTRMLGEEGLSPTPAARELVRRIQAGEFSTPVPAVVHANGHAVVGDRGSEGGQNRKLQTANCKLQIEGGRTAISDLPPAISPLPSPPASPVGPVPVEAEWYVERAGDGTAREALGRRDAVILVRGPRGSGKTSLLARAARHAEGLGMRAVFVDAQQLEATQLAPPERLFFFLAEAFAEQLGLGPLPDEAWNGRRNWTANLERTLRREVLPAAGAPVLWVLDGADRLFLAEAGPELFRLLRAWHNERARDPGCPWAALTVLLGFAAEPHLSATEIHASPFNVATTVELGPFGMEELAELNRHHGEPLREPAELGRFAELTGGHPELAALGFRELARGGMTLADLERAAGREDGPFAEYGRRLTLRCARSPELAEALREALARGVCPTPDAFYRLRAAGILAGDSPQEVRVTSKVAEAFLRRQLLGEVKSQK